MPAMRTDQFPPQSRQNGKWRREDALAVLLGGSGI